MDQKSWTIKALLAITTDYLEKKGIDSPRLTAEILLAHQLDINRVKLYLDFDRPLNDREVSGYRSLIRRRLSREPIQHITGVQEFWSMEFAVDPKVLIPRPESELLVEQVVSLHKEEQSPDSLSTRILDLGTGSGVLAIALARELEGACIWASDISQEAIDRAILNSRKHGVEDRIQFIVGDLLRPFMDLDFTFDVIISNPPYIASEDFDILPPEIRDHEPRVALDGRKEGMFFIEKIIREGSDHLNPRGWLLLEMDPGQVAKALKLIEKSNGYAEKKCIKDYSHNDRVVMVQKKKGEAER
jgi:release factor glutamine methyltransferase